MNRHGAARTHPTAATALNSRNDHHEMQPTYMRLPTRRRPLSVHAPHHGVSGIRSSVTAVMRKCCFGSVVCSCRHFRALMVTEYSAWSD